MTVRNDPSVEETGVHKTYRGSPDGEQATMTTEEHVTRHEPARDGWATARRVVGLIFGVVVTLIALRILLLALGANEGNALVDGIYGITEPFVAPFRGVFSIDQVQPAGRSVLDIAAVVAVVGWSLIFVLIQAILRLPEPNPR